MTRLLRALFCALFVVSFAAQAAPPAIPPAAPGVTKQQLPVLGASPQAVIGAAVGDSRTFIGSVPTAYASSATRSKTNQGLQFALESATGGRVVFPAELNFGVGGDTSAMILARNPAAIVAAKAYVSPAGQKIGFVLFFGCATNDRTSGATAAQTIANLAEIERQWLAAGIPVYWIAEIPRGDTSFPALALASTQLAYHIATEAWQGSRHGRPGVKVARPYRAFSDQSSVANAALGYAKVGLTYDGLHPTPWGIQVITDEAAHMLRGAFPSIDPLIQSGADVCSADNALGAVNLNPMMLGSGGTLTGTGLSGTVAASYNANFGPTSGSTIAIVASVVAPTDADPRGYQKFVITGTAGSGYEGLRLRFQTNTGTRCVAAGAYYAGGMAYKIEAGQTGLAQVAFYLANEANVDFTQSGQATITANKMSSSAMEGVAMADRAAFQSGATQLNGGARIVFNPGATVNATIYIGRMSARPAP